MNLIFRYPTYCYFWFVYVQNVIPLIVLVCVYNARFVCVCNTWMNIALKIMYKPFLSCKHLFYCWSIIFHNFEFRFYANSILFILFQHPLVLAMNTEDKDVFWYVLIHILLSFCESYFRLLCINRRFCNRDHNTIIYCLFKNYLNFSFTCRSIVSNDNRQNDIVLLRQHLNQVSFFLDILFYCSLEKTTLLCYVYFETPDSNPFNWGISHRNACVFHGADLSQPYGFSTFVWFGCCCVCVNMYALVISSTWI